MHRSRITGVQSTFKPTRLRNILFLFCSILIREAAFGIECSQLGRYECRHSSECTLDCKRGFGDSRCTSDYFCRPKTGRCERGFIQDSLDRKECEARPGCTLMGGCYCPCEEASEVAAKNAGMRQCNCACGHGVPTNCESN